MPGSAPRYRLVRELGHGGMGSVELVWDEERQECVARKRILDPAGGSLVRFKREFRATASLRHQNLVRLHELDEDALGPYFTMEYVQGQGLLRHCARSERWTKDAMTGTEAAVAAPPLPSTVASVDSVRSGPLPARGGVLEPWSCDWERLDRVVPQIVRALDHLHASGVVHCDLKPGNAMVDEDGVVKLLDFGVVAEMQGRHGPGNAIVAGTPAYMAPERIGGAEASPAVDLYALGVSLFELITGTLPFDGVSSLVTLQHLQDPPPSVRTRAPDVPQRYEALCAALLEKDPARRPTTRDVRIALGESPRSHSPLRPRGEAMVGRANLQAALRARAERVEAGAFETANLQGPSGAGKTALALWLAHDLERRGWLVLRGRASTREHVAFNAIDGAVDDLAGALAESDLVRIAFSHQPAVRDAATLFPVLRELTQSQTSGEPGSRSQGFDALIGLLAAAAAQCRVLLLVDDLQWADADSMALLDALCTHAPPRVFLVMTTRDDVDTARAGVWLRKRSIQPLLIGPLDDSSVREVIARAARSGGTAPTSEAIGRVASAAAGRPFLAEALGRALAYHPEAAGDPLGGIASAIERTSADARELLAFALAAGRWMSIAALAEAIGKNAGEIANSSTELEAAGLLRRDAGGGTLGAVDVYHDQVRERAATLLEPREIAIAHERFVACLAHTAGTPPWVIVNHLVGAGRVSEAATLAREAARIAEEQRAFDLASAMYEVALSEPAPDRLDLLKKRASALERVGAYAAAASSWQEIAARASTPEEKNDAVLHEAHALLGDNQIARGYLRLDQALVARGQSPLGPSLAGDVWSGVRFVVSALSSSGPSASKPPPPPDVEARVARDMSVGQLVAYFDPLAGIDLMRRSRAAAEQAGANDVVAFADYTFAYFTLFGAGEAGEPPLYRRFRQRADRFAAARAHEPQNVAWPAFLDGVVAMREGGWDVAAERMDAAIASLQRAGEVGTQSIMYFLFARAEVEMWRQDAFAYERTFQRIRTAVDESQTGTMRCQFEMCAANLRFMAGDLDGAAEIMSDLQRSWPVEVRTVQHLVIALGMLVLQVYRGEFSAARALAARMAARELAYDPTASIYASLFAGVAALAEVGALRAGDRLASARRVRSYARVSSEGPPFARAEAMRALAYLDEHEGRAARALARLEEGEREALAYGQKIDAAACRFARGKRLGGDGGAALIASSRTLLAESGANERLLTMSELPGAR